MKEQVICPVCGYVAVADRLGKACPVCGVNRSVFKPFKDEVSSTRRPLMNLHLHQLVIHFSQALSVIIFFLLMLSLAVTHPLKENLRITVQVMMVLLPFSVLAGMFSGMFDANIRFKRLKGGFLKTKLLVAGIFLVCSVVLALLVLLNARSVIWIHVLLSGLCMASSVFLGFIGGKLSCLMVKG